jgi:glycosyltransferase involved in cell wall biosynthesis
VRILHVTPTYLPAVRYGGPIRSVHGLAKAQAARGHDVEVFTTNVDGPGVSPVPLDEPVPIDGVKVRYFPTGAGRRLFRSPAMGRAVKETVAGFDVVHIHCMWVWPTTAAARAARKAGVPYVIAPRGMLVRELIRGKSRLVKTLWIALFDRANLNRAAAVHLTTQAEGRQLAELDFAPARVAVIGNGVDLAAAPAAARSPGESILYLGRLSWEKGLDRLIPAMAHAPGVELVIAGDGEPAYRASLETLAADHGVADRIRFVGHVDDTRKWALIAKARFMVLPSYSENFGVSVAEAMSVGCPVIVSSEVGLADVVREGGAGLAVDGAPATLGRAIAELHGDEARRTAMSAAALATAQREFRWESIAAQSERLYDEITAARPRR